VLNLPNPILIEPNAYAGSNLIADKTYEGSARQAAPALNAIFELISAKISALNTCLMLTFKLPKYLYVACPFNLIKGIALNSR
jgi:hypothetical protein